MNKYLIHYVHPTALSLSLTAGIFYILCAIFIAIWPEMAATFFGDWFHGIDLKQFFTARPTVGLIIRGLITLMVSTYLAGALYAWIYNKCLKHCIKRGWIKTE